MQSRSVHLKETAGSPPAPELFQPFDRDAFRASVPKPVVQLDDGRHGRVEVISPPAPAGLADERRQVVGQLLSPAAGLLEAEPPQRIRGGLQIVPRAQDVQVILDAQPRVGKEVFRLRKSFEQTVFHACAGEGAGDLPVFVRQHAELAPVGFPVRPRALGDPLRQRGAADAAEDQRHPRGVQERQRFLPVVRRQAAQAVPPRAVERKRIEHGRAARRKLAHARPADRGHGPQYSRPACGEKVPGRGGEQHRVNRVRRNEKQAGNSAGPAEHGGRTGTGRAAPALRRLG